MLHSPQSSPRTTPVSRFRECGGIYMLHVAVVPSVGEGGANRGGEPEQDGHCDRDTDAVAGSDEDGQLIYTNEEDAVLAYTRLVDDVTIMSPKFRSAFSYKLAYKVAPVLCGEDRSGLGQKAQMNYELEFSRAKAEYFNERKREAPPEAEAIEGR